MLMARVLLAGSITAFAALPAAGERCAVASFGQAKANLCRNSKCRDLRPQADMTSIRRGFYLEYISLAIYEDRSSWVGVDLDRSLLITVQRYPADMREGLQQAIATFEKRPDTISLRAAGAKHVDFVRKVPLPPRTLGEMLCVADRLWRTKVEDHVDEATHAYSAMYLVDRGAIKKIAGFGIFNGDAKALETLVGAAKEPDEVWYGRSEAR